MPQWCFLCLPSIFCACIPFPADEELLAGARAPCAPGSGCAAVLRELQRTPRAGGWNVALGLGDGHSPGELSMHHAARVQYVPGNASA